MKNNSLKFRVSTFDNIWDTNNEDQSKNYDAEQILDIIRTGSWNFGVAAKRQSSSFIPFTMAIPSHPMRRRRQVWSSLVRMAMR